MPRTSNDAKIHRQKHVWTQKCANLKVHKILNQKYSMSNVLLSGINIIYMHCKCVHVIIIITRLIVDTFQHVLNVEYGGYAI